MHHTPLITLLAVGLGLALLLGLIMARLRLPPLVGYLLAGIAIGPATPGFVGDLELAAQLAEIGVILLMFGVGLHFSLDDLLAVRHIAVPGALVQILVATLLGLGLALVWGWTPGAALVFGLALSVASTVVLLRALEAREQLGSSEGRIAIGWLVVEDLAMVLVLVLLPALAPLLSGEGSGASVGAILTGLGITLAKVLAFIALMLVGGRKALPWLLWQLARSHSRELFTLGVIASALGIAFGAAALFDVSFALGAFFAGMMMRESEFSHRAADETLPLREAFSVLFFVSVGMLFDPRILLEAPWQVLLTLLVILVGKTIAAIALVLAFRYPLGAALTVGAGLAQIGEFSFILASLGQSLGLLTPQGQQLILAGALLSIVGNTALFALLEPARQWILARSALARRLDARDAPLNSLPQDTPTEQLQGHVVVVGHGKIGSALTAVLDQYGAPWVALDLSRDKVDALRQAGKAAVAGDGADPMALVQAHVARAGMLIITPADPVAARHMLDCARQLNPGIHCLIHTDSETSAAALAPLGEVFVARQALINAMGQRLGGLLGHRVQALRH